MNPNLDNKKLCKQTYPTEVYLANGRVVMKNHKHIVFPCGLDKSICNLIKLRAKYIFMTITK